MKNKFLRRCVGCRQSFPKEKLIRVAKDKSGKISFEKGGRGAYLCLSMDCFEKALRRKKDAFSFTLKQKLKSEEIERIREIISVS